MCRPRRGGGRGARAHLVLGQFWQRATHMLLEPVEGHGGLIGQDVDALSELVRDWFQN